MSSRVEQLYGKYFNDLPNEARPFARSLVVTRIAAHFERSHDTVSQNSAGIAWLANTKLLNEEILKDQKGSFERAVALISLPKSQDPETEWYRRWLKGNGLYVLQDGRMRDMLCEFIDTPAKSQELARGLDESLRADVDGLDMNGLSDTPEAFNLLVALLVCNNLAYCPMSKTRSRLMLRSEIRRNDDGTDKVMALFGQIPDTKDLYRKYLSGRVWIPR